VASGVGIGRRPDDEEPPRGAGAPGAATKDVPRVLAAAYGRLVEGFDLPLAGAVRQRLEALDRASG